MKKHLNSRMRFIHLYDPKKEGLGSYDVHYINAYKKDEKSKYKVIEKDINRYAA